VPFGENNSVLAFGTEHAETMVENYTIASQEHEQGPGCGEPG
jgi:hypothetical protein